MLAARSDATPAADTQKVASPAAATPVAFDPANATLIWQSGPDANLSDGLYGGAIDANGLVYVFDSANHRIQKFDAGRNFLTEWGGVGTGDGQFNIPLGTVYDAAGRIYVADAGNNRVQVFDLDGNFIAAWGEFGAEDGQFISPIDLAVDANGNVYVGDDRREDLQVFAADGTFVRQFGGSGQPEFQGLITLAPDGTIWGADGEQHLLHQWTREGELLQAIPVSTSDGQPVIVTAFAFDPAGNLLVPDGDHGLTLLLDPNGAILAEWTATEMPVGFPTTDGQGALYLVTPFPGSVSKYTFSAPGSDAATATPVP